MQDEQQGIVEQVFSHAVNLFIPAQNELYTLLGPSCDNAPNSCRIALEHCNKHFRPGERVRFHRQGIEIGVNKTIDFECCQLWQPVALSLYGVRRTSQYWQAAARLVQENIINSSSLFYFSGDNIFYQEINRLLQLRRTELISALQAGNKKGIEQSILALMGLGIGLTPTGDDYLAGLSAILFIDGHPGCRYRDVFISALTKGQDKTTLLSVITLREAIAQRYRESIYHFIYGVIHSDSHIILQRINDIKQIGSSSGCDMLCGMADALALTPYFGGNYVNQDCG